MVEGSKECRSPKYPVNGEWGDKSSEKMHERAGRGGVGRSTWQTRKNHGDVTTVADSEESERLGPTQIDT